MTLDFLGTLQRTGMCGELRAENAGQARSCSWAGSTAAATTAASSSSIMRDRSGIAQGADQA